MKGLTGFCLVLAGMISGVCIGDHIAPATVHAQNGFGSLSGCLTAVPKDWGDFVGASTYGMVFEDREGTLRFLQRPVCSTSNSANNVPTSAVDLQIVRK
jgi:hypothetical protein